MAHNSAELAALVGSRLCHDLISPIGAIQNGLELMSMAKASADEPEFQLIEDSCNHAIARIRLFRVAFGLAGEEQKLSAAEILRLCADYTHGSRLRIEVDLAQDRLRPSVQLGLLGVLCCETFLPMGGEIRLTGTANGWELTASGPKLAPELELTSLLSDGQTSQPSNPARVQFFLLGALCEDHGLAATVQASDEIIRLGIG